MIEGEGRDNHPLTIGAAAYGRDGASARVRLYEWLDRVAPGATVIDYAGTSSNRARELLPSLPRALKAERRLRWLADSPILASSTIVVSRQVSPFDNGALASRLLSGAARGVYDFDDAIMLDPRSRFSRRAARWLSAVRHSDVVIAGNDYLADLASVHNPNTVVIPSCVDPARYERKEDYTIRESPIAAWIGSPSTERYLRDIEGPLLHAHGAHGLRLLAVSAGSGSLGPLDSMTTRVDWSPHVESTVLRQADLGIMPLLDDPWSRGKCAYKLLQYGAAALPMIGSPVGASAVVLSSAGGLSASSAVDWIDALDSMLTEPVATRAHRGHLSRRLVESEYSFAAWEHEWRTATGLHR